MTFFLILVVVGFICLLLGFLAGWLVEWRMDLAYWHSYFEEEESVEGKVTMLGAPSAAAPLQLMPAEENLLVQTLREQLTIRDTDLNSIRSEQSERERELRERESSAIAQRDAEISALRAELVERERQARSDLAQRERDWLDREAKLREDAEKRTRAVLEQMSATDNLWRQEATAREAKLMEDLNRLRVENTELSAAKNDADDEWQHELGRREQQWQELRQAEAGKLTAENQKLSEQLTRLQTKFTRYQTSHPDDLSLIEGIGARTQIELRRGGIGSYAALAATTPEQLQRLLNPPQWRSLDFAKWIAQARTLAEATEAEGANGKVA